ncbi:hypothetical protein SLEP1_g58750, partial [Rubroshorea leprosula]
MVKKERNRMSRDFMLCLAMVLVQVCYAVMNITSKLAMESGMKPLVPPSICTCMQQIIKIVLFSQEKGKCLGRLKMG